MRLVLVYYSEDNSRNEMELFPWATATCHFFVFVRSTCCGWSVCLNRGSWSSNMALPARWRLFVGLAVIFLFNCINAQNPFRSFQYKYSFKPPYLAQKDGSVPFWGYTGSIRDNIGDVRCFPYSNHFFSFKWSMKMQLPMRKWSGSHHL